jgi:hypothetical protein
VHFRSALELEQSSARGCHLCTLIWQELDDVGHYGVMAPGAIQDKKLGFLTTIRDLKIYAFWVRDAANQERHYIHVHDHRGTRVAFLSLFKQISSEARNTALSRSPRTDSKHWLDFVRTAMKDCHANHEACRTKMTKPEDMPCRLLDLGSIKSQNVIRLIDTASRSVVEYAALSYCWGPARALKLTRETETALREGIPPSGLPRTIRDAANVALALDLQFLWVDATCIFQDSIADWEAEAKNVLGTYSNSILTIAATGATSCDEGLFCVRDPLLYLPCEVAKLPDGTSLAASVSFSPLLSWFNYAALHGRGWVVQERLLAPRTINFGITLVWECRETLRSDCTIRDADFGQQDQRRRLATLTTSRLSPSETPEQRRQRLLRLWYIILGQYTSSALSYRSDRLAAVLGIMSNFQEQAGLTPWFGLWKPLSIWDLMWSTSISFYNDESRERGLDFNDFPSWTWARLNLEVTYELLPYQAPYSDVVYTADLISNQCGCDDHTIGCSERAITIVTKILTVDIGPTPGQPNLPCVTNVSGNSIADLSLSVVWQDDLLDRERSYQFLLLVVRHGPGLSWRCAGLLVMPISSDASGELFERLGMADFVLSEQEWLAIQEPTTRTIRLV